MAFPLTGESLRLPGGIELRLVVVDPSADSGVAAEVGSIALRDNSGTGEFWLKFGASDTEWEQVTVGGGLVAHDLAGAFHNATDLATLNSKINGATLIDTGDSRLSDARDPNIHAGDHTDGTDDIQDATIGQKGLATAAQVSKLNDVEANADVTDAANVAAAGAGMLDTAQAWTKPQRPTRTALTSSGGNIPWSASTAQNHLGVTITEDAEVNNPTGTLVPDTPYVLFVVCNGTNELTWGTYFDWGTDGAYDFSAETNGKVVAVYMFAYSATRIHLSAKGGFAA